MAKVRSPNYPIISLGDALEAIRPAFKGEGRNKMSRLVLAKHMGYTSLNGRALGKIGAVRAYGLIEGSGDDLRLSEDLIIALTAPDGPQKQNAIARLAFRPSLFKELREEFPDSHPSMDNLRFQLIQRHFTEEGAGKAAETYLATMRLVGVGGDAYNPDPSNEESDMLSNSEPQRQPVGAPPRVLEKVQPITPGQRREIFTLDEGDVTLTFPENLSPDSYGDLESFMQLFLRKAKRRAEREKDGNPSPDELSK